MNDPATIELTKAWLEKKITDLERDITFHAGRVEYLSVIHESHRQRLASLTGETPTPPSEELPS